jgi:hypothetical protein
VSVIKTSCTRKTNDLELFCYRRFDKISAMFWSLRHLIGWIVSALGSRKDLILENLALRQQLLALHAQRRRPRLSVRHKLFWVLLRRLWSGWKTPLLLVTPRTVVEWQSFAASSVLRCSTFIEQLFKLVHGRKGVFWHIFDVMALCGTHARMP